MIEKFSKIGRIQNGHPTHMLAHNLNVRFEGIDGKAIINSVSKKIAISAGSACTTQLAEPSHVIIALGLDEEWAHSSIRIRCERFNTEMQIEEAMDIIYSCIRSLDKIHGDNFG